MSPFTVSVAPRAAMLFLLAAFASPCAFAAGATEVSLDDAVRIAVERAPSLAARHAEVEAAQQESRRAGALPDPMLSVGVENLPVTGADAFDANADFMTMKKIGLSQEVPARAQRDARRRLAEHSVDEAQAQAEADAVAVRRAAADAWIDYWVRQHELVALRRLREQAALAAHVAHARVSGGSDTATDALAADAAVLDLDNRVLENEAAVVAARSALQRWVGPTDVAPTLKAPDFTRLPHSEAELLARLDQFPELHPVAAKVETAAAAIDVARAERRPNWNVEAAYGQRSGDRSDMLTLEVGIGLPLFTRNRQDRGVAAREAEYRAALDTREDLRREQAAQLQAAYARWEALKQQVALHEERLLPLAGDRSATALDGYRAGGELRAWLDARRDELSIHLSHAEHLGELGRAWAALAYLLPGEDQP